MSIRRRQGRRLAALGASQRDAPGARGKVLYVANANRNTVSVFDTKVGQADRDDRHGDRPARPRADANALALSPTSRCSSSRTPTPTTWPSSTSRSPARARRWASSRPAGIPLRSGSRRQDDLRGQWQGQAPRPTATGRTPARGEARTREYIAGLFQGTLSTIPMPDPPQMALSQTVYECSPFEGRSDRRRPSPRREPDPRQVGDPSPITHVVYIIKENRTYDQVFGDLPQGNGDPPSCLFPGPSRPTTTPWPASSCCSTTSTSTARSAPTGTNGPWAPTPPTSSSGPGRSPIGAIGESPIPSEGEFAIARPAGGLSLGPCGREGVSYRSYGEFVKNGKTRMSPAPPVPALQGHFDPLFRSFDLDYPDVKRAERFLEELAGFEKAGEMPRLVDPPAAQRPHCRHPPGTPTALARWATTTWPSDRSSKGSARAGSGSRWRSSWSRTTPRTARTTWMPTGRWPWRSALHQAALGRFDDVQHLVDAPDHGADPGPGADEPVRRRRPADVPRLHGKPDFMPFSTAPPGSTWTRRTPRLPRGPSYRRSWTWRSRTAPMTWCSTRSSGRRSAASTLR